jgi:hypothetical protein
VRRRWITLFFKPNTLFCFQIGHAYDRDRDCDYRNIGEEVQVFVVREISVFTVTTRIKFLLFFLKKNLVLLCNEMSGVNCCVVEQTSLPPSVHKRTTACGKLAALCGACSARRQIKANVPLGQKVATINHASMSVITGLSTPPRPGEKILC